MLKNKVILAKGQKRRKSQNDKQKQLV